MSLGQGGWPLQSTVLPQSLLVQCQGLQLTTTPADACMHAPLGHLSPGPGFIAGGGKGSCGSAWPVLLTTPDAQD